MGLVVMGIAVILAVGLGLGISLGAFRGDGLGGTAGVSSSTTVAELGVTSTTAPSEGSGAGDPSGDTEGGAVAGDEAPTESGLPADGAPINTSYAGLSMFRGNGHRSFYGTGPLPTQAPRVLWRFPEGGPMSSSSSEGGESRVWAGTGWTGQPVVVEQGGVTKVMFGAYDRALHVLDADTGKRLLPDLPTGDLIKGSVMADPDGYPLLYSGSRDNFFRVVALDRAEPEVLWKLDAASVPRPVWNNDWDSSAVIVGDYLFEGGENSYFFIVKLNRAFDGDGKVTVQPRVVLATPGYDDALFAAIGDRTVSIESSPALHLDPVRGDRVYFTNSGGRVVGLDISVLGLSAAGYGPAGQAPGTWETGVVIAEAGGRVAGAGPLRPARPELPPLPDDAAFPVVFDYWTGDDVDATPVIDEDGMLYVAVELERMLSRAKEVGQLIKLDPYRDGDPLVWSVADPAKGEKGGMWATPALYGNMIYEPTHTGRLLGVDRRDGRIVWEKPFTYHAWGSAAVVDDILIVGDTDGWIHAYDVSDPDVDPPQLWQVQVPGGGAVESTPAVWRGRIYVGSRNGYFYCFGEG
ncbi:MAG: outer membrane protein assembly factor BamB family protein [Thermoleophilia bacterium]